MQDMRYLVLRGGNTWLVTKPVPRHLRPLLGKSHLRELTKTTDPVIARGRRHAVLARFQTIIDEAQRQHGAGEVMGAAAQWREHFAKLRRGDLVHVWDLQLPRRRGTAQTGGAARRLRSSWRTRQARWPRKYGQPTRRGVLRRCHGHGDASAAPRRGLAARGCARLAQCQGKAQYRSIVTAFVAWCERSHVPPTIEAITPQIAGRYIMEAVAKGVDPIMQNSHISALSSYWKWLRKRVGITTIDGRQSRSKAGRNRTGERNPSRSPIRNCKRCYRVARIRNLTTRCGSAPCRGCGLKIFIA